MATRGPRSGSRTQRPKWIDWSDEDLLSLRMCDLGVRVEGSWLEEPIDALYEELESHGLRVRPHFYLSSEWFSPSGVPNIAIPFFLAHPRLMKLERRHMLEVEGESRSECMRLLRHETGHALQHAFRLERRRGYQRLFGPSSQKYPDYYLPNPASKRFVHHIKFWYAQSHPDEDFAETFAVWLTPRSEWKKRYRGWPALKKLEYVDELMTDLAGRPPLVHDRSRPDSLSTLKQTLKDYYREKRERFAPGESVAYDEDLRRLFRSSSSRGGQSAALFLRRHKKEFREELARWTDEYAYTLDVILGEMIARAARLKLRAVGSERQLKMDCAILLTVRTLQYVFRRREWHPL
jgi:hypothetical protein